jgi:MoxR-like ATPase
MALDAYFKPESEAWRAEDATTHGSIDRRDGSVYVFHNRDVILAVNVALATGRPLFVRGVSGSGKSSLARSLARIMKRRYYERVISSRTQLRDLLWSVDELQRLRDARQEGADLGLEQYIQPGTLWWAFDPVSASKMGRAVDPTILDWREGKLPVEELAKLSAVVLLDEIDKADPDLPNDLLVPLGSLQFDVEDIEGDPIAAPKETAPEKRLLVVITTNEEREMPPAFLRRCVVLTLPAPTQETLVKIASAHFRDAKDTTRFEAIAKKIMAASTQPSVAEYLDAIRASEGLDVMPDDAADWASLSKLVLWKK